MDQTFPVNNQQFLEIMGASAFERESRVMGHLTGQRAKTLGHVMNVAC